MYDSIIIGCGPAGMTAALYLLRAGKKVILLERESIGGQVAKSPRLENFPSIASIAGEDFASQLFDQITDLGASFEVENGLEVIEDIEPISARLIANKANYEFKRERIMKLIGALTTQKG